MRRLLLGLWLVTGAGLAGAAEVPTLDQAGYHYCTHEANDAMALGRMAQVFKQTQADLESDPYLPPHIRPLVPVFFQAQTAGQAPTYAHFALRHFQKCLQAQKVKLSLKPDHAFSCLTRVDIPYFYFLAHSEGVAQDVATARLEQGLSQWAYPPGLIRLLAEPAWQALTMVEMNRLQLFVFNSCLLPAAEVRRFYGGQAEAARAQVQRELEQQKRAGQAGGQAAPGAPAK